MCEHTWRPLCKIQQTKLAEIFVYIILVYPFRQHFEPLYKMACKSNHYFARVLSRAFDSKNPRILSRVSGCSAVVKNNSRQHEANKISTSTYMISKNLIHSTSHLSMFIQVEDTPNPNSLKFYPGHTVLESGTASFQDKVQASMKSPLAKALFRINGVRGVFFAQDFITVTKEDDEKYEWGILKPQIFSEIMIFYTMGQPILYGDLNRDPNAINEGDSDVVKEIKELISERIRPTIQEDGGDLEFVSYENNIVKVRLQGACTSCPSSVITLKNGIKNMLQFYIPDVQDVEQVVDDQIENAI